MSDKGSNINIAPYFFARGNNFSNFSVSNGSTFQQGEYQGLQVVYFQDMPMAPGVSVVCNYDVTTSTQAKEELKVVSTPMLTKYREQ